MRHNSTRWKYHEKFRTIKNLQFVKAKIIFTIITTETNKLIDQLTDTQFCTYLKKMNFRDVGCDLYVMCDVQ